MSGETKVTVALGPEVFRFASMEEWVDKARSRFREARRRYSADGDAFVCIDKAGRICRWGAHFRRASEDDTYPIVVYFLEAP